LRSQFDCGDPPPDAIERRAEQRLFLVCAKKFSHEESLDLECPGW